MIIDGIQQHVQTSFAAKRTEEGQNLPLPGVHTRIDFASFSSSVASNFERAESLSGIARKYDVRSMSPREMSTMSQTLYQSGAISFQDHALLSFQPELGTGFIGAVNQADTPKDFIAHWEQQLKIHEQHGEESFAKNDRRILNILGNLDALSQQIKA